MQPYGTQFYNLALVYAPNPAITMGIEYTRIVTGLRGAWLHTGLAIHMHTRNMEQRTQLRFGATTISKKELTIAAQRGPFGPPFFISIVCYRKRESMMDGKERMTPLL